MYCVSFLHYFYDFHHLSLADIITRLAYMDEGGGEEWKVRFTEAMNREFSKDTFV